MTAPWRTAAGARGTGRRERKGSGESCSPAAPGPVLWVQNQQSFYLHALHRAGALLPRPPGSVRAAPGTSEPRLRRPPAAGTGSSGSALRHRAALIQTGTPASPPCAAPRRDRELPTDRSDNYWFGLGRLGELQEEEQERALSVHVPPHGPGMARGRGWHTGRALVVAANCPALPERGRAEPGAELLRGLRRC